MALTDTLLGAFAITANPQTTALPDKLLGGFGLTDHTEERVQGLDAELANKLKSGFKKSGSKGNHGVINDNVSDGIRLERYIIAPGEFAKGGQH